MDYRKIYVILDGTIILNANRIPGKFFEIIKRKLFVGKQFKKKRAEHLYKFFCEVNKEFAPIKRLRNIFLMDGTPVFDLVDIPDTEKCVLISNLPSYRGIQLSNINNVKLDNKPVEAINKKEVKLSNLALFNKFRMRKFRKKRTMRKNRFARMERMSKKEFNDKYLKDYKENTFVEQNVTIDDWQYFSDNEDMKIPVGIRLQEEFQSRNELMINFTEFWASNREKQLRRLLRCDSQGNIKEQYRGKIDKIENLVDKYNKQREERVLKQMKRKPEGKQESVILKSTNQFMKKFIQDLGVPYS